MLRAGGYRSDEDYYTDRHLIRSIDRYLARGANYLLNVGPMADGSIDVQSAGILQRIGRWYHAVRPSLELAEPAPEFTYNRNVLLTRRENALYVHLNPDPTTSAVKLKPIRSAPVRAKLLNDGRPVEVVVEATPSEASCLRLCNLPVNEFCNTVMVVELAFDALPTPPAVAEPPFEVWR